MVIANQKLLVISNGHGEDIIAVKIIHHLQTISPSLNIQALPMVGQGFAYQKANIDIITEVKSMPSGGFVNMDQKQLWEDLRHGLLALTYRQYQALRQWTKSGNLLLAVGDILPLLLGWISGRNYFFVGTAKSEYYLRDDSGWLTKSSWWERYWGSFYYPWEYWLMNNHRCQGVFPRDSLTHSILQQRKIRSYNVGNPMMDDLSSPCSSKQSKYSLRVLLLPGSRMPEVLNNWELILEGVDSIITTHPDNFICLGAIAPSLSLSDFQISLEKKGWQLMVDFTNDHLIQDEEMVAFQKKHVTLILSQNAYAQCLNYCNISLAMAGTATEQFVGLGKPVIAFPGKGPQYNSQFAHNQKHLLGISLQLIEQPQAVGKKIQELFSKEGILDKISLNGQQRLGETGASSKIAKYIQEYIYQH